MALKFRRGTTAQQSGSLSFGEPYVNTTLGTLIIGGANGDIVLSSTGTGSTGTFGPISGSGLDITGNANIAGNLTLGGNITIGDNSVDNLVINADLSSSLIPNNDNAFTIGTAALRYSNIYGTNLIGAIQATNGVVSGSSQITYASISSIPAGIVSGAAQVTPLLPTGVVSGSAQVVYASISSIPAGIVSGAAQVTPLLPSGVVSGSAQVNATATTNWASGIKTQLDANAVVTASAQVTLQSTNGFTAYNTALATITGSLIGSASTAKTTNDSQDISISNLNTFSGSQLTQNSNLATISGSLILSASNANGRLNAIEAVSGTFARTNSANTFSGNQTITGSLFVSQDLIVAGSSSIQNISSSNLVIGAAYVTLNTNSPSSRFAGLNIIDSGSAGISGSLLYDAVQDEFIFVHKGNGLNVTSSHFVQGPQTYDNLGNELYLTNNRLTKGTGVEHIVDSQISDDGTTVTIPGALTVTGNITGPIRATNGVVSGSSQITYASISSIPAGIVSGSSQIVGSSITTNTVTVGTTAIALGGSSTTLAGLSSVSSTGFTGALTGNASTATTLATARTINGTSFNGSADITIPNLVSGSAQITYASISSIPGGIVSGAAQVTPLLPTGTISGSSQVVGSSITTNTVTFNGTAVALGGSGTITAANPNALTIGTGLSGTSYTGASAVTIANTGVLSITSNTGLSTNASATGNVTITNTGVTSNVAGTGISVSGATGAVTITNTGVTSAVAGTGVSVSGATGAVTFSIGQAVATTSAVTFASVSATGDIVAYSTSDKRHKNNIQTISNAVLKVKQLNGVTWEWNDDVNEVTKSTPKTGLIAQEVQQVLPQVITERADGFLALDYSKMVGLLVEAIKEQQTQIDQLKAQIGSK
jgi:hypothetical protein